MCKSELFRGTTAGDVKGAGVIIISKPESLVPLYITGSELQRGLRYW